MSDFCLSSTLLEYQPIADVRIPLATGHLVHGNLHSLVQRCDMELSAQLHHGSRPRPFTLSPLVGGRPQGKYLLLRQATPCYIRLTHLDGGHLWERLKTYFLEAGPIVSRLGSAELRLTRLISPPSSHPSLWVGSTTWHQLATLPPQPLITFFFRSPVAFSRGNREYDLFPQPLRLWMSLLRIWNIYAPESLRMEKSRVCQVLSKQQEVVVTRCDLQTQTLHFSDYQQKGFLGTCTYHIRSEGSIAADLTALAALAPYAGVGYKTTMGMGQVHTDVYPFSSLEKDVQQ